MMVASQIAHDSRFEQNHPGIKIPNPTDDSELIAELVGKWKKVISIMYTRLGAP